MKMSRTTKNKLKSIICLMASMILSAITVILMDIRSFNLSFLTGFIYGLIFVMLFYKWSGMLNIHN